MSPYQAALDTAAFFDLSDRTKIELTGPDARTFLHNLCTQDIKNLPVGETREAFLTTNKARVIAHVWIAHLKTDVLLLDTVPGQSEKLLAHLNRYLISEQVELADRTRELAFFRIAGPKTNELVDNPTRRQRLLALDGADLIIPAADADATRQKLLDAGVVLGDAATYNTLRVEAGLPEFGIDIDEDRLAMEVNRPDAISYAKGCYLGQETIVMARDRGQMNRKMMGLVLPDDKPLTDKPKLFRGSDEVGQTASSVFSPRLQKAVALAYLRRGAWDAGMEVTIETSGGVAVVHTLPFVSQP